MLPTTIRKELVKYVPMKEGKKWVTRTTNTKLNGGLHRQEEFKKGAEMLEHCAHHFRNPRLFHICFTGADLDIYQRVLLRFCRALKGQGVQYRYKAALENDLKKGQHLHVMIVLGGEQQTHRFIRPGKEVDVENESTLRKAVRQTWEECCLLDYSVNCPATGGRLPFLQFNKTSAEKFNEAVEWMSYIYKARSKPASGTIYFSDRQD